MATKSQIKARLKDMQRSAEKRATEIHTEALRKQKAYMDGVAREMRELGAKNGVKVTAWSNSAKYNRGYMVEFKVN